MTTTESKIHASWRPPADRDGIEASFLRHGDGRPDQRSDIDAAGYERGKALPESCRNLRTDDVRKG